jgi:hypothetical protein
MAPKSHMDDVYHRSRFYYRSEWWEWAVIHAWQERRRRDAALKTKSLKPPNKWKGPAHDCSGVEPPKVVVDLLPDEIDHINGFNRRRARARRSI